MWTEMRGPIQRVEVQAGTGVVVAIIPAMLDLVGAGTLGSIAVANDDKLRLETCVGGGEKAVPAMFEMATDVNSPVVAAHVAVDDGLMLEAAVNADEDGLVPSAVLVNAGSVTVVGSGVPVFDAPVALQVDGDERFDPAKAEVFWAQVLTWP